MQRTVTEAACLGECGGAPCTILNRVARRMRETVRNPDSRFQELAARSNAAQYSAIARLTLSSNRLFSAVSSDENWGLGRSSGASEVMLPLLQRRLYDFRMDFCDLIVSMEQAEISPRPVLGAIVVVSGLAVSFLLWLLYVHHASTDFAGRWMFLPALNALLNGLCAIALCVGLYFIKDHNREAHRTSMLLAFAFSSVFLMM
jgi:hypothetical protein